ncbi:DNA repair protein RecO [Nitrincola tibetensis]|uniref:DNA repair protein RecO n=1 Tax=Nitrincola tibetensis TaxID=2219697 RepID=A0A364NL26_9GAMM|nr:DNA repair protein RecO [Nitrincola tibetensis]RAU17772.1 DNA repair protein RecO [Nitrincola tibetensis]
MQHRVEQAAAYVLHTRPYRETSLLVDLFSLEYGRLSLVANGARRPGSKRRHHLQPFQAVQVSWRGRHELKTLQSSEVPSVFMPLTGTALLCGLYVNELLQRLLSPAEPCPRLYLYYAYLLNELQLQQDIEGALRTFERQLLETIGYGIAFDAIQADISYTFDPNMGFTPVENDLGAYLGSYLLEIAEDRYENLIVRRIAKRLMREALSAVLGDKPLKSRELFLNYGRSA